VNSKTADDKVEEDKLITADDIISKTQQMAMISLHCKEPVNEEDKKKEPKDDLKDYNEPKEEDILAEDIVDYGKIYVDFDEDIYCIGFKTFLRTTNAKQLDRIVLKCIFAFVFQVLVVGLLMMNFLNVDTKSDSFKANNIISEDSVFIGDPSINMTRLCCCFLLHISLLPEITSAKSMLQFAKLNPTSFVG
jgi:hypothetical protein